MGALIDKFPAAGYTNYRLKSGRAARVFKGMPCAFARGRSPSNAAGGGYFPGSRSRSAGSALIVTGRTARASRGCCARSPAFCRSQAGSFALEGGDPERTLGEQAHYLGHADALKGALTAGENLAFWAGALGGDPSREACRAALARLGLAHVADFPARALSAGQKRRVALARLLVAHRPLWLLDEPTTALDAAAQAAFAAIMRAHLAAAGSSSPPPTRRSGSPAQANSGSGRRGGGGVREAHRAAPLSPCGRGAGGEGSAPQGAWGMRAERRRPLIRRASPATFSRKGRRVRMTAALALFLREWRIARRIGGGASIGAVFFLILVAIMPFALGPDLDLLARLGPAILWIAALLATLLGLDRLFQADHDDGSLDVLVNAALPLELVVLVKCAAHWTTSALPLIVVRPLFGLMLAMAPRAAGARRCDARSPARRRSP